MKLRERAKLTQRQVAEALGLSVTTISSWETGRKEPRLNFAQTKHLMDLYGCTIDELVAALEEFQRSRESS